MFAERAAEKERKRIAAVNKRKQIAGESKAAEEERQRKAAEQERLRKAEQERQRKAAEQERLRKAVEQVRQRKAAKEAATKKAAVDMKQTNEALYIFLTAISLLSVYLYSKNRKLQKHIEKQEKDISILREDLVNTKEYLIRSTQELTKIKEINATMNQQMIERRDSIPLKEIVQNPKVVENFFMSIPNQDGTFSHTAMCEKYDPTSCFYSFVDNKDGTFLFKLEEDTLNLALKYPHKIIDPVCDIVDGSFQYSTNVDIVRYGKAVQSYDSFKVIEKMKIRLI